MDTIKESITALLKATNELHRVYPHRKFTLDGRLVGDLGEVLAEQQYDLVLYEKQEKHYDGYFRLDESKKVQVKATMKETLTYPVDHVPEYYLGLRILSDGSTETVFNGPGRVIKAYLDENRKRPSSGLYSISNSILRAMNYNIREEDRVPVKSNTSARE